MKTAYLLTEVIAHQEKNRVPVWVMRQAGRILPEYRAVRAHAKDFKTLVKTPELASEVTLQPVDILGVDAAIIFSDILVIPEAMGLDYEMIEQQGPFFPKTIQTSQDVADLKISSGDDLQYVLDAIALTKKQLPSHIPLIGFAGSPWTIFCYMIEGKGSKTFSLAKKMLFQQPALSHRLLEKITQSTIAYLQAQVQAGADVLQLFDSWAGALDHATYVEFGLSYIEQIVHALQPHAPVTVFSKGVNTPSLKHIAQYAPTIGLDWQCDIDAVLNLPENVVLQGYMDPCVLYADEKTIVEKTIAMLDSLKKRQHIANLGHGVYPDTDWKKVKLFIDTVKNYRK